MGFYNLQRGRLDISKVNDGTISVLLADDDDLIREAVSYLLDSFSELRVAATAKNGLEAVQLTGVRDFPIW